MLKHTLQSFVVETKRRRGRSTTTKPREDAFSAAVRAFSREIGSHDHPIADVAPDAVGTEAGPVQLTGSILRSLVEDLPIADKPFPVEALKARAKARARKTSQTATRAPLRTAVMPPRPDEDHAAPKTTTDAKTKKAAKAPLILRSRAKSELGTQAIGVPQSAELVHSDATSQAHASPAPSRRGLILRRYVHRTELKFGERWKLRQRKPHR
jgi:hypothetical protein